MCSSVDDEATPGDVPAGGPLKVPLSPVKLANRFTALLRPAARPLHPGRPLLQHRVARVLSPGRSTTSRSQPQTSQLLSSATGEQPVGRDALRMALRLADAEDTDEAAVAQVCESAAHCVGRFSELRNDLLEAERLVLFE